MRRRTLLRTAALVLPPALAGCASWVAPQTRALHAAPSPGLPPRAQVDGVPFIAQAPLHCGPAALAMVLRHLGREVTAEALADAVYLPARGGALQAEMLAGVRRHDAWPLPLPPRLDALLAELADGRPVVVLLNLGLSVAPTWHYAVLTGYDLPRDEVRLHSGPVADDTMALPTFELTWQRVAHWAFTALRPGELPASATPAAAREAALAFERVAAPASAARVYAALLRRWPDDPTAGIGLGNALMAAGDTDAAARAFAEAARRHDGAAAWNNLAMAEWTRGDTSAARRALARAEQRLPAEPALAAAVAHTRSLVGGR